MQQSVYSWNEESIEWKILTSNWNKLSDRDRREIMLWNQSIFDMPGERRTVKVPFAIGKQVIDAMAKSIK